MIFNVITLFPEVIKPFFEVLPYKRFLQDSNNVVNLIQLRDYAIDKRGTVDDKPYSGGKGMILRIEPIYQALQELKSPKTILLSPSGKKYTQESARRLSEEDEVTLICGRYEGIDHRVEENLVDEVISVGDYILAGGELASLVVMESVIRLLPGILDTEATKYESFESNAIEHPQYTRPEDYKGWKVPEVLLSGNHKDIETWKKENSRELQEPQQAQ